jgi:hypothetical protein
VLRGELEATQALLGSLAEAEWQHQAGPGRTIRTLVLGPAAGALNNSPSLETANSPLCAAEKLTANSSPLPAFWVAIRQYPCEPTDLPDVKFCGHFQAEPAQLPPRGRQIASACGPRAHDEHRLGQR